MTWISWTLRQVPLWLPDTRTDIDSYLFEINTTIKQYNESITLLGSWQAASREEYDLKSIKWSPWRTLVWLWRREWIVLQGYRSYLDPAPQVITAVLIERSTRHFSYDGDHMRHTSSGDVWYAVEAITTEAFEVERSQGELRFPTTAAATAEPQAAPAPPPARAEPALSPPSNAHPGPGRPSTKDQVIKIFEDLPDVTVADTPKLAAMARIVRAGVSNPEPKDGFGLRAIQQHLREPFKQRRERLKEAERKN